MASVELPAERARGERLDVRRRAQVAARSHDELAVTIEAGELPQQIPDVGADPEIVQLPHVDGWAQHRRDAGLVARLHVQGLRVGVGVHGDRADAHAAKLGKAISDAAFDDILQMNDAENFPAFRDDPSFSQQQGLASDKVSALTPAVKFYNEGEYDTAIPILWRIVQGVGGAASWAGAMGWLAGAAPPVVAEAGQQDGQGQAGQPEKAVVGFGLSADCCNCCTEAGRDLS